MRAVDCARRPALVLSLSNRWSAKPSPTIGSWRKSDPTQSEAGEDFGEARLCDIVRSSAGESADVLVARIFDAIDRFAGTAPRFDDITVMVLKKL